MLSGLDKSIIRIIQEDLPLVPQPYKKIAQELGITEDELMNKIKEFNSSGIMRRFGIMVNHRNVGLIAKAMVVWTVPENLIKEVSKIMITFSKVPHCYQRPTFPDWTYNIFTMIHGETKQECGKVVKEIVIVTNINDYKMLYSTEELKKVSIKYFME